MNVRQGTLSEGVSRRVCRESDGPIRHRSLVVYFLVYCERGPETIPSTNDGKPLWLYEKFTFVNFWFNHYKTLTVIQKN